MTRKLSKCESNDENFDIDRDERIIQCVNNF